MLSCLREFASVHAWRDDRSAQLSLHGRNRASRRVDNRHRVLEAAGDIRMKSVRKIPAPERNRKDQRLAGLPDAARSSRVRALLAGWIYRLSCWQQEYPGHLRLDPLVVRTHKIMVPFAGRFWCAVCPFPAIGQWIQRLSFLRVRRKDGVPRFFGLKIPWPKRLKNIWLQNALFLCLAIFSSYLVTRPLVSAGVLGGMMGGWGVMGNPEMMFGEIPYDSPERLLDLRYLHGDITRREYRRMLRHIE